MLTETIVPIVEVVPGVRRAAATWTVDSPEAMTCVRFEI